MSRGDSFAKFMTSTAGGTSGSSNYGGPSGGIGPGGMGGGSFKPDDDPKDYGSATQQNQNQQQQQNTNEDKKTPTEIVEDITAKVVDVFTREEIKKLSPLQLQEAQNLLNNYKKLGETNPLKLRSLMMSNIFGGIFGKDQTVSDMEGNVVTNPEDAFDNDGNLKKGFRFTREGIIGQLENIDPEMNIMKSLEFYEPQLIMENFGLPQTSAGLDKFANLQLTGNKTTDAMIIEARERLAQDRERQDRASGIMTASSAPPAPPPVVPPVVPPAEDEVPENPILNPIMSQRDPFNLAKFYASLPQYTQQGVMSPSLMQYYRNLGLFPRV